ncbi:O-antigen ligase family protein [Bacillus cereus]|nr:MULTISPECIES: O-antigen ligase family protein [Bacillus]MCU7392487.1 O-antigen ligase family protein [Bacillus sp. ST24]AKR38258.1 Hypothetical protein NF53_5181 [Bacillus thuringiensis serovar indiana]ASJ51289.1 hypothetical protein BA204_25530 [Bacillus cereus]EJQ17091.1 hypothetical protein IE1_00293 [Bacillus cereus BAG3O-2]EJQ20584.1 hypothetical protein IE7_05042 [Bacillus cereus BAG4O-1]
MKLIFILSLFLFLYFSSLCLILMRKNKKNTIIIFMSIILVVITLNISPTMFVVEFQDIRVQLLLFVLVILNCTLAIYKLIQKQTFSSFDRKTYSITTYALCLLVIISCFPLQFLTLQIFDINLFVFHLTVYCNILLMGFFFNQVRGFSLQSMQFFQVVGFFSLFNSILSVIQYIFNRSFLLFSNGASINYTEGLEVVKRVVGVIGASNGAGNLGVILFPILVFNFLKRKNSLNLLVLLLNIVFVILTLTRISYVAILCQVLIIFLIKKSKNKKEFGYKVLFASMVLIGCTLIISLFYSEIFNLLFVSRGGTQEHRFIQFINVFQVIKENFAMGIGAGQYTYYASYYLFATDLVVHSQVLNILLEQGIVSFMSFVILNISLLLFTLRNIDDGYKWLPISLFIGNLITTNFNPNQYYSINIYIYFFIMLSLTCSTDLLSKKK